MNEQTQQYKGKQMKGVVTSVKMNKSVVVEVVMFTRHSIYKKAIKHTRTFLAHNDFLSLAVGDHVRINETKPMSKNKHFKVVAKLTADGKNI